MSLRMESRRPARKVTAGGVAGALSVLLVFVLNTYVLPVGKQLTPEIASALTTVLSFLVGYLTPPGENERVVRT